MSNDNFIIEQNDIETAQNICRMITDKGIQGRAVANAVAANIASKFFDGNYDIDTESGLHNISAVLEDIDISDIYLNENYIDVRIFFNEDEICVPKSHFDSNLLPIAYMFLKINEDLSGAYVMGFIAPENVEQENPQNGYYSVDIDSLVSFYDIESLITSVDSLVDIEDKEIFAYLDNDLENKDEFYSRLLVSKDGRERFAKIAKAKTIFQYVSLNNDNESAKEVDIVEEDLHNNSAETDTLDNLEAFNDETLLEDIGSSDDLMEMESDDSLKLSLDSDDNLSIAEESDDIELAVDDDISLEINEVSEAEEAPTIDTELQDSSDDFGEISLQSNEDNVIQETIAEDLLVDQDDRDLAFEEDNDITIESDILEEASVETEQEEIEESLVIEEEKEEEPQEIQEYSTQTTPSFQEEDLLEELSNEPEIETIEVSSNEDKQTSDENIETLFNGTESQESGNRSEEIDGSEISYIKHRKKSSGAMRFAFIIVILGVLGYLGVMKFMPQELPSDTTNEEILNSVQAPAESNKTTIEEAMPVETVDNNAIALSSSKDEKFGDNIPAIEQNLDASILVSNLNVDWEVPSGYASNTAAKRYLVKLGKIIQLNLKTELLLLNKPPISNKIEVELKYNSQSKKFETVGIITSSGEKTVDNVILSTVNRALSMNLSTNTDSFSKLQGNPVLIIHL